MSESHARRYLRLELDSFRLPPLVPVTARVITYERFPQVAALMVEAYAGTFDDEDGDLADALGELAATERGAYGPPLRQHWLEALREDGSPCSAVICTRFAGIPFVAFAFTSHLDVRRGLATRLIADVVALLHTEGEKSLSLVVTVGNPAELLYDRLGFRGAARPEPLGSV
jgi:ribosomal protein S18 acetylase RimI-like enzyme